MHQVTTPDAWNAVCCETVYMLWRKRGANISKCQKNGEMQVSAEVVGGGTIQDLVKAHRL